MERFNALGRGMQIMLVGSVLLLIDTFFNWQEVSIEFLGTKASSGVSAWHGFWGVVMGLLIIVLIAWLVARLAAVDIPVPVSLTGATLAFLIFAFALIKNLADDYSTFWSYLGVGLAALVAVGGWLQVQEAGGVENLRSEASSVTSGIGGGAAATAAGTGAATESTVPAEQEPMAAAPEMTEDAAPAEPAGSMGGEAETASPTDIRTEATERAATADADEGVLDATGPDEADGEPMDDAPKPA